MNIHNLPDEPVATARNLTSLSCERFIAELAGNAPFPGGGGTAALVGALGVALGNMVGSLTVGKKKYADVEAEIKEMKFDCDVLQADLVWLVARDAEVFAPLAQAYGLPSSTEEEKAKKAEIMEAALNEACSVPLEIMRKCSTAVDLLRRFAEKGSKLAVSDAGCGAALIAAAIKAAALNVFINTKLMNNKARAEEINIEANSLLSTFVTAADTLYLDVFAKLK